MAAEAQGRMQNAVEGMLETLEKEKIRPLLKNAHLNASKCCENQSLSKEQLEQCMQRCFIPTQQVQEVISQELSQLQDRLARCAKQCQDTAQDKLSENSSQSNVATLQGEMESCIVKCVDTHMNLLPKMMKRIQETVKQVESSSSYQ